VIAIRDRRISGPATSSPTPHREEGEARGERAGQFPRAAERIDPSSRNDSFCNRVSVNVFMSQPYCALISDSSLAQCSIDLVRRAGELSNFSAESLSIPRRERRTSLEIGAQVSGRFAKDEGSAEIKGILIDPSATMRQEGTVLRMKEMAKRCTTATGSGRRRSVGALRRGQNWFSVLEHAPVLQMRGLCEPLIRQSPIRELRKFRKPE
jgi:hypothetical protein